MTLNRKVFLAMSLCIWVMVVRLLSGCSAIGVGKDSGDKVRDLEFTVTASEEVPEELQKLIDEKKAEAFKLTYTNDQGLYIAAGYGQQQSGGYSIAVKELYLTDNSIVFRAELMGPQKGEEGGNEPSYPYIVVKTELLDEPVIFQ